LSSGAGLTIASVLLAIRLLAQWTRRDNDLLVALPGALLALRTVDLLRVPHELDWGAAIEPALCLALVVLGQLEQRGGSASRSCSGSTAFGRDAR
jgi:hypothetical protein